MICLLASMVIRRPFCLKMQHISFMICSMALGVRLDVAISSFR